MVRSYDNAAATLDLNFGDNSWTVFSVRVGLSLCGSRRYRDPEKWLWVIEDIDLSRMVALTGLFVRCSRDAQPVVRQSCWLRVTEAPKPRLSFGGASLGARQS